MGEFVEGNREEKVRYIEREKKKYIRNNACDSYKCDEK